MEGRWEGPGVGNKDGTRVGGLVVGGGDGAGVGPAVGKWHEDMLDLPANTTLRPTFGAAPAIAKVNSKALPEDEEPIASSFSRKTNSTARSDWSTGKYAALSLSQVTHSSHVT